MERLVPTGKNTYLLIFCAHALCKISSSWQVRGITLSIFFGIQPKVILALILNNILNFRILAQAIL